MGSSPIGGTNAIVHYIYIKICCKMGKLHDENKDLKLVGRKCKISYHDKTIRASKSSIIGNKTWGRIDFLCHYCGWHFIWDNTAVVKVINTSDKESIMRKRDAKKLAKAPKLTNKRK